MAGELQLSYVTGRVVYAEIFNANGLVWDTVDSAFETYATAQYANYTTSLTELGPTTAAYYTGTFPAAISAGIYSVLFRRQMGGSPDEANDVSIERRDIEWSGSVLLPRAAWALHSSDPIAKARTWTARHDRERCSEIVECTVQDTASYAMDFSPEGVLNPNTAISTADSASDVSGNALTISNLRKSLDQKHLIFDVAASDLTAATDYEIRCTITATDGAIFARQGMLRCVA